MKEESLLRVSARSHFEAENQKDALYTMLASVGHLAPGWQVSAPTENEAWEFCGTANTGFRVPGIKTVTFSVVPETVTADKSRTLSERN